MQLSQLLVIRGSQGRAGELVGAMEAMAEQTPEIDWRDVLAWLYAENGQLATARRLLRDLDPARFTSDRAADPWVHWAINLFGCSRACALLDNAELAAALYPVYAEQGGYAMTATSVVFYGVVDHALADLATAAGWHSRAQEHRRRALAAYQRMPAPLFAAALAAGRSRRAVGAELRWSCRPTVTISPGQSASGRDDRRRRSSFASGSSSRRAGATPPG